MIKPFLFILIFLIMCYNTSLANDQAIHVNVSRVIDGDTFEIIIPQHPSPLSTVSIRIKGIDTPEIFHYSCKEELELGLQVKKYLIKLIENKQVTLSELSYDKYGGRVDAVVMYYNTNIGEQLITLGMAHPYNGKTNKLSWCIK